MLLILMSVSMTPYIYRNHKIFKLFSYAIKDDFSKLRWTVYYPEDFELIRIIFKKLYPNDSNFNMFDIIKLMESDPTLIKINSHYTKNQTL